MMIFWTSNQFSASGLHIIYSYFKSALLTELFLVMELCQQNRAYQQMVNDGLVSERSLRGAFCC